MKNVFQRKLNANLQQQLVQLRKISLDLLFLTPCTKQLREAVLIFLQETYKKEKESAWIELISFAVSIFEQQFDIENMNHTIVALRLVLMVTKLNWNKYISFQDEDEEPEDKRQRYEKLNAHLRASVLPRIMSIATNIIGVFYEQGDRFLLERLDNPQIQAVISGKGFWELTHIITKFFWSIHMNDSQIYADLLSNKPEGEHLRQSLKCIINVANLSLDVSTTATASMPQLNLDVSEDAPQWKAVKWTLTFIASFINSSPDSWKEGLLNAQTFPGNAIAELVHKASTSRMHSVILSKKSFVVGLNITETLIRKKNFNCLALGQKFYDQIIDATFHELCFTEADEELLTDSPMEFLENNIEVCYGNYDTRTSAYKLLKSLLTSKLIKKSSIPSMFFGKVRAGVQEFMQSAEDKSSELKYAYACVIHRLSSILKKNVSGVTIYTDFILPFLGDISKRHSPHLQFIALQIVQTYKKLIRDTANTDAVHPIVAITNEILVQVLDEPIGVTCRVAIQVQFLRALGTLVECDPKRCSTIVEPTLLKLVDIALRLLQLDCGIQTIVLDTLAIFIDKFPTLLDPVLAQLCGHFIQHVYATLQKSAALRAKSENASQSLFQQTKDDKFDDEQFNQEDSLNSAIEGTLRTLYTIVATMVGSSKWHLDVQRTVCPFLKDLLAEREDSALCIVENRELIFDIFDVIACSVESFIPASWELLQLAYEIITNEDDQFFVCECGGKVFDIAKAFITASMGEFCSRGLDRPMFELCSIFLNPTDDEYSFFDDSDRLQALAFFCFYVQTARKHSIGLPENIAPSIKYVMQSLQEPDAKSRRALEKRMHIYRAVLSVFWFDPRTFSQLFSDVRIDSLMDGYVDFVRKAPPWNVYDRNIGITALARYLRMLLQENIVNAQTPRMECHIRSILTTMKTFLLENIEQHTKTPQAKPSPDIEANFDSDADFESDSDDSDLEINPRSLDDGHWAEDEGEADVEELADHPVMQTPAAGVIQGLMKDIAMVHSYFANENLTMEVFDRIIAQETAFLQRMGQ